MPKKDTIGRRLARGITKAQTFSEKHLAPRYKTLESQFYPQTQKPKRKSIKRKKPQVKYYIHKGKAYPIYHPKKRKRRR